MPDPTEELERRRAESNARADSFRASRDRLNADARTLAEERAAIVDQIRAKSAEAQDHRRRRDELNTAVREEKRLREEWNQRFQELAEKVQQLRRARPSRQGSVPVWRLRKDLKELEFRHMTTALTGDQEKRLLEEMKRLEATIREQEDQLRSDPTVEATLKEFAEARDESEKHHAAVGELAEGAQREHEAMVVLFEAGDELRRQADDVQVRLLEVKANADEAHRQHIAAIEEVRDIEKLLYAARGGRAPAAWAAAEAPREEDFLARLKKGEKVSTEDLLELQKRGRA
ncbi:MAG TPA: hypothetical protein VEE86_03620 [Thermoplasmata archaeon]|nr:hypothetical protein [Thermoplasmata archaeon]